MVRVMLSFFKSILKSENPEEGIYPPLMNVTMHPLHELSELSNLSTTSVVGAWNMVGLDMQKSLHNMQTAIKKGFNGMNQSVGTDFKSSFNNLQKCKEKVFMRLINQSKSWEVTI